MTTHWRLSTFVALRASRYDHLKHSKAALFVKRIVQVWFSLAHAAHSVGTGGIACLKLKFTSNSRSACLPVHQAYLLATEE
jgi:hypothetical protein